MSDRKSLQALSSISKEVNQLCCGLFGQTGMNGFSFSRILQSGERIELWSNPKALKHSFFDAKHIQNVKTTGYFLHGEVAMYGLAVERFPSQLKQTIRKQLQDQKRLFDHDYCLIAIEKTRGYTDYFVFYSPAEHTLSPVIYIDRVDVIKHFSNDFLHNARDLIKEAEQYTIKPIGNSQNDHVVLFTDRELSLIPHLVQNFTAKEIAKQLFLSPRTIEHCIEGMKEKTGSDTKAELSRWLMHYR